MVQLELNFETEAVSKVPEEARQETKTQNPDKWKWVETSVWTESMLTALVNGVRGGKWYSLIDKVYSHETLLAAWKKVRANKGAAGVDNISINRFNAKAQMYLEELARDLRSGKYRPLPVKRVHIPKGKCKTRPLGIPAVKDRIVQTALKMVLEPIFEKEFLSTSYGFRPGLGCKDALREVDRLVKEGYVWVVDADFKSYFDTIPHNLLMERISGKVSDGSILILIEQFLKQDIMEGMERWNPGKGTPQGAVVSPLLANLYLHQLDIELAQTGYKSIRYADDLVVLCRTREEAEASLKRIRVWTKANELELSPEKTHIGNCLEQSQGFEFLGYKFEAGKRQVRPKSLRKLKDKIREKTRRTCGRSIESVISELNPTLVGWFEYFKHAHHYTFNSLDGFIRRRLRAILRKHKKKPGSGLTIRDHTRWPNAFFAEQGLFTLKEAYAMASQSR